MNWMHARDLDIILVGRAGIDFNACQSNRPFTDIESYTKSVGGSPANIAQGTCRLGLKTGFIGKIAGDGMGDYIVDTFQNAGINTAGIVRDSCGAKNCLAITEVLSPNQSSSYFYREQTADLMLAPDEISESYVRSAAAVMISGTALSRSPSREAVFTIIEYARRNGTKVLLDIDYRPFGWLNPLETAIYYSLAAEKCDLIIGNREEYRAIERLAMPENQSDLQTAQALHSKGVEVVIIKEGAEGSCAYTQSGEQICKGVIPVEIKKTFGSGDAYASALLYGLFNGQSLAKAMELGTACAAIVLSGPVSCVDALPDFQQLEAFLKDHPIAPYSS